MLPPLHNLPASIAESPPGALMTPQVPLQGLWAGREHSKYYYGNILYHVFSKIHEIMIYVIWFNAWFVHTITSIITNHRNPWNPMVFLIFWRFSQYAWVVWAKRQVVYIPVLLPHRCSHCGHDCDGRGPLAAPLAAPQEMSARRWKRRAEDGGGWKKHHGYQTRATSYLYIYIHINIYIYIILLVVIYDDDVLCSYSWSLVFVRQVGEISTFNEVINWYTKWELLMAYG